MKDLSPIEQLLAACLIAIIVTLIVSLTVNGRRDFAFERACAKAGGQVLKIHDLRGCYKVEPIAATVEP